MRLNHHLADFMAYWKTMIHHFNPFCTIRATHGWIYHCRTLSWLQESTFHQPQHQFSNQKGVIRTWEDALCLEMASKTQEHLLIDSEPMKILYGSRNLPKLDRLSLYYWRVHMTVQVELKMQSVFFFTFHQEDGNARELKLKKTHFPRPTLDIFPTKLQRSWPGESSEFGYTLHYCLFRTILGLLRGEDSTLGYRQVPHGGADFGDSDEVRGWSYVHCQIFPWSDTEGGHLGWYSRTGTSFWWRKKWKERHLFLGPMILINQAGSICCPCEIWQS